MLTRALVAGGNTTSDKKQFDEAIDLIYQLCHHQPQTAT